MDRPRKLRAFALCGFAALAGLAAGAGCGGGPSFLSARDGDIRDATRAIGAAHDDAERAKAYSSRGVAYSEKARFSRIEKLTTDADYEHLFDLAIKDHDQAVALNPASSQVYFNRAQAYYDRGAGDLVHDTDPYAGKPRNNPWLNAAATDFEKALAIDPNDSLAYDRLGLAYESNGEADKAIQAYTQEMALDTRLGKMRLSDAYCVVGYERQLQKDFKGAVEAYRRSLEFGTADDKSCPIGPSAAIRDILGP